MNKTDRMLAIVLELQRYGRRRAEDLAAVFETSVRTIYRDMQALCETGVPIIGEPGQGYSLAEGYFLPPISFTAEEAVTLLVGSEFVKQRFDTEYAGIAEASRSKIEAILPLSVRTEATRLRNVLKLLGPAFAAGRGKELEVLSLLRRALLEERKVRFRYAKKSSGPDGSNLSLRTVAPYGLTFINGTWLLVAFCELRQELRHFRLSRMSEWIVLEDKYRIPPDFDLQQYKPRDERSIIVRVRLHPRLADRIKETHNYYLEELQEAPGELIAILRVNHPEELLQWVLGWGGDAVVLEPESLRQRVRKEAACILQSY
jgi:predicted DNA-binding transcriptional regulator YafY